MAGIVDVAVDFSPVGCDRRREVPTSHRNRHRKAPRAGRTNPHVEKTMRSRAPLSSALLLLATLGLIACGSAEDPGDPLAGDDGASDSGDDESDDESDDGGSDDGGGDSGGDNGDNGDGDGGSDSGDDDSGDDDSGDGDPDGGPPPGPDAGDPVCNAETCGGCCDGDGCAPGDQDDACGAGGDVCTACGAGSSCQQGACVLDPLSRWDVVIEDGELPATTLLGLPWDPGALPDAFVELVASDGFDRAEGSSQVSFETLTPIWNETVLSSVPARVLLGGMTARVQDFDGPLVPNDFGSCEAVIEPSMFADATVELDCPATPERSGFVLRYRIRPD